jgi:cell shape-determining protein MreD
MLIDPRTLILFGSNALLLYLTLLVNSSLAAWSLHLLLLGPMLVLPTLYLSHRSSFLCIFITGLWVDAALPVPYGLFTIGFLIAGMLISLIRGRFRAEQNYHPVLLTHSTNLFFIVLLTFTMGRGNLSDSAFWIQVFLTSLLSHLALLIVAPWFFNLERLLFEICHLEIEPEDFPLL